MLAETMDKLERRSQKVTKCDFERDMLKLMKNAVSNHIDFGLIATQNKIPKCINNSNYTGCHIINEELAGIEKTKTKLKFNKPIYLRMALLNPSKVHMCSVHYDVQENM